MLQDDNLLFGDQDELAAFLGVSARTIQRYKTGKAPLPEACRKLLRLRMEGDLSALGGSAWEGFQMHGGKLALPGWRGGFGPHEIRSMFFRVQQVSALEITIRERDKRINELERDIAAEIDRAERYRGMVRQESRWGLIWAGIAD